jgi:hypothetical protein
MDGTILERSNNASLSLVEQEGSEKVILLGALIVVVLLDYHNNRVAPSCKVSTTSMPPSTSSPLFISTDFCSNFSQSNIFKVIDNSVDCKISYPQAI